MKPDVKIDEDLSERLVPIFEEFGYVSRTVRQQGWDGLADNELWPLVQSSQELLVTADKGFGDLRKFQPGTHYGIVLLRTHPEDNLRYAELCRTLLERYDLGVLVGYLTVVTEHTIRIRRKV